MGIGQFEDRRLDKGGRRSSSGLCMPVAFASVAWRRVSAVRKCGFTGFSPIPE